MIDAEFWKKGFDLASIATSLMIISAAVLLYVSRSKKDSSRHSSKK